MPLPTSELANYPSADAKESAAIKADQYAQLESAKKTLLDMSAGLASGKLAPIGKAVTTSSSATTATNKNIADLTVATTPPPPLTPEQQAAKDKAAADKLAAENKSATDNAINGALGNNPNQPSQAEIDAQAGIAATQTQLATLKAQMDARSQQLMDGISREYDALIAQQEVQNKAYQGGTTTEGLRSGRARYAPVMQASILDNAVTAGLTAISNLQAKKQNLLMQAQQARDDNSLKALNDSMTAYRDTVKEERKLAQDTYENAIKASAEARAQAKEQRDAEKSAFDTALTQMDRMSSSVLSAIEGMSEKEASDYIQSISQDYGFDPNLFLGTINTLGQEQQKVTTAQIATLAGKYPSAGIDPETDTFTSASDKIRSSKEYKLDIQKAELDISNTNSLIKSRAASDKRSAADNAIDYSDPVLQLYAKTTGGIVGSPSMARAVLGYADSIGLGKEVIADDFTGPLLDNQIRASEYKSLVEGAFQEFKPSGTNAELKRDVNMWLSTDEAKGMDSTEKEAKIQSWGGNPRDFLY